VPRRKESILDRVEVEEWLRELPEWKKRLLRYLAEGNKLTTRQVAEIVGEDNYVAAISWLRRLARPKKELPPLLEQRHYGWTRKRVWIMRKEFRETILETLNKIDKPD
jgi:hypothetical protein